MASERVRAYGWVMRTLGDLGPTKLHPSEQDRIREAADALLLGQSPHAPGSSADALADVEALAHHLVEADRWDQERAERLVSDVAACSPSVPVAP